MNISANYSSPQYKIYNRQNNVCIKDAASLKNKCSDVNFTGLGSLIMKPVRWAERSLVAEKKDWFKEFADYVGPVLGYPDKEFRAMTKGVSQKRLDFLGCLAEKYNHSVNFDKKSGNKAPELFNIVKELYGRIKKPKGSHLRFIDQSDLSMNDIKYCFDTFSDDPRSIANLNYILSDMAKEKISGKEKLIMDIVKSPNAEEYVYNYPEYKTFIKKHADEKDVIRLLDKEVAAGKFDSEILEKNQEIAESLNVYPKVGALTKEHLVPFYSEEGNCVLEEIGIRLHPTAKSLEKGDAKAIQEIYKTTTYKNENFRLNYLDHNYHNNCHRVQFRENEIEEINQLFKLCDENPDARAVIKNLQKNGNTLGRAYNYLAVFNECGISNIRNNLRRVNKIIKKNQFNETASVIKAFKDKKESSLDRLATNIRGMFRKKGSDESYKKIFNNSEEIVPMPTITGDILSKEIQTKIAAEKIETQKAEQAYQKLLNENVKTKKAKRKYILSPIIEKQPSAKKLVIINDAKEIIKEKLGSKVYSEQEKVYARRATRMRVKMLPEIFASIKETRAAARANGTFNKSKTVKNEDAVDLYIRINGKNRKLVNYMLKVRNADGTRKYDVKQIIEELTRLNRESLQKQRTAAKENPFTRNDEKALYSAALENQIATFGKLHRSRKS